MDKRITIEIIAVCDDLRGIDPGMVDPIEGMVLQIPLQWLNTAGEWRDRFAEAFHTDVSDHWSSDETSNAPQPWPEEELGFSEDDCIAAISEWVDDNLANLALASKLAPHMGGSEAYLWLGVSKAEEF